MSNEDDLARGRESDQKEASESRLRKLVAQVAAERRDEFWLRLGFDVSNPSGFDRLFKTLGILPTLGIDVTRDADIERLRATMALPAALGINITKPDDVKEKADAIAWAVRAQERAATFGKRLLFWLSTGIGLVVGTMSIIKYLMDWKPH